MTRALVRMALSLLVTAPLAAPTRLPNGWSLAPAGRAIAVTSFPLGLAVSPDERWAVAIGARRRGGELAIVDLERGRLASSVPLAGAWFGVTFFAGGRRIAASGGLSNRVVVYDFDAGRAKLADSIALGPPWSAGAPYPQGRRMDYGPGAIWPTGIAADDAHGRLWIVSRLDSSLRAVDAARLAVTARLALPGVPWTCLPSRRGDVVYVSLWSAAAIAVVDAGRLTLRRVIAVGEHPCDLAEAPDGRLFVTNANRNTVSVVDPEAARVTETLCTALDPSAPDGSTPDAVALDRGGARLVVANAGNDDLALFDVSRPGASRPLGFVPAGWYPTAVRVLPSSGAIVVANARGLGSVASAHAAPDTGAWCGYLSYPARGDGAITIVPAPDAAALARGTRAVLAATPRPRPPRGGPIPSRPGGRTPIRHVFYVFRENRSYDQVLGDLPGGDGDSSLCLFGERVTPNAHALAREFVLLDHVYCDADGSADGHNWGMAAYATDDVVKSAGANPIYAYEGGDPLVYPSTGYLWDACRRAGVSVRSYGEFVFDPEDPADSVRAAIAGLEGQVAPHYRGFDVGYSDLDRYRAWLEEFDRYDLDGDLPQLEIIRLPNDHTAGTCTGQRTPRALVAENDLALGMIVSRIGRSRYWNESLVIAIEDDASNGPDHVDAHRTVALLAGPYVRRGAVDHTPYTTCGVLRTIELVLGLPPLSQFDQAATPLSAAFTSRADARPFSFRTARVDLSETNVAGAYGQAESDRMDFRVADAAPADELNGILWRAMRGADPAPPPIVRGAFSLRGAGPR